MRDDYFAVNGKGHLWVKSKELLDGSIRSTEECISDEGLKRSAAKYFPSNTVLVAMYGANVGQLGWLGTPATVNQAICGLVVDDSKSDWRYLFYALLHQRGSLITKAQGAAQQNLNQDAIKSFELPFPNLPTQRRIAGILSAYDDLIENNLRRIKILEDMAQSLYREWFVHFRFPGHESVSPVDSPLGPIPDGWEVKKMPEAVEVRPKVPVPKDDEIPFVPMGSLSENSMLIGETETRTKASGARFQNGDTLFARITPCLENGKTGFVQFLPDDETACCGSTEFIVLRSRTVCPEYVYLMARSDPFRDNAIKSMSGATGRQRVQEECFEQFFLAQPPADLLERFQSITRPQFQLIHSLNRRNQSLRQTRDLLLPKLLSVSDAPTANHLLA